MINYHDHHDHEHCMSLYSIHPDICQNNVD